MQLDPSKCVQCSNLNVKLKTAYSLYLDKRGRFKPNDPFFFCSDDCFKKALEDFYDFERSPYSGPASIEASEQFRKAFKKYHDKHYGDDWYKKTPVYGMKQPGTTFVQSRTSRPILALRSPKPWRRIKSGMRDSCGNLLRDFVSNGSNREISKTKPSAKKKKKKSASG